MRPYVRQIHQESLLSRLTARSNGVSKGKFAAFFWFCGCGKDQQGVFTNGKYDTGIYAKLLDEDLFPWFLLFSACGFSGEIRVWAMKVKGRRLSCHRVSYDYQRWSLLVNSTTNQVCDGVTGSVIFLMKALDFLTLLEPFGQPVDESLLVQAAAKGWQFKVLLGSTPFTRSKRLLEPEILTNVRDMREERMKKLYKTMAIKRTVKNGQEEIYGCSKTTPRLVGRFEST